MRMAASCPKSTGARVTQSLKLSAKGARVVRSVEAVTRKGQTSQRTCTQSSEHDDGRTLTILSLRDPKLKEARPFVLPQRN